MLSFQDIDPTWDHCLFTPRFLFVFNQLQLSQSNSFHNVLRVGRDSDLDSAFAMDAAGDARRVLQNSIHTISLTSSSNDDILENGETVNLDPNHTIGV